MCKLIILLSFLFQSIESLSQFIEENDSVILWSSNRPLIWEDFKGVPKPVRIHNKAGTGMKVKFEIVTDDQGRQTINPLCYFQKYRSWTLTNDKNSLAHEQLHFDIQELYIRKLKKELAEKKPL